MKSILHILLALAAIPVFGVGFSVRGGGDEVALEFLAEVATVLKEIRDSHPELASSVSGLALPEREQILVIEDPLMLEVPGGTQDSIAVNEPATGRIWINRARWASVRSNPLRRAIALHEVASLKGLEGTGAYPISASYLAKHLVNADGESIRLGRERLPYEPIRQRVETNARIEGITAREVLTVGTEFTWVSKTYGYSITYFHAYHSTDRELWGRPVLSQHWWKLLRETPKGAIYRHWKRQISVEPEFGVFERTEPFVSEFYQSKSAGELSGVYEWKNGRRGAYIEKSQRRALEDGSVHSTTERNPAKMLPKTSFDCVQALTSPREALAVSETEQMERDVAMLTVRARAAYDALVQTRTWDSVEATAARQRFEEMWENIYVNHVKLTTAGARSDFVRRELRKAREKRLLKSQE